MCSLKEKTSGSINKINWYVIRKKHPGELKKQVNVRLEETDYNNSLLAPQASSGWL